MVQTIVLTTMLFRAFFSMLLLLYAVAALAQQAEEETVSGELLENFFRDNEQASESDAQLFLENLENIRRRPLNLNLLEREDLAGLRLCTDLQLDNLLRHRTAMGLFLSVLELQAVPGWESEDVRRVAPFVTVPDGMDKRSRALTDGLTRGDDELLLRWGRPDPPNFRPGSAEGKPNVWAMRFRHNFDNRLRFGFTAENDAGEAFFKGSNRHGFDFYSAHLFAQGISRTVQTVALGDFTANLGQGLLLYTSFAPGKSAEAVNIMRSNRRIGPYGAFGEAFFLRGAAGTFRFGRHWELTALHSNRRRDANTDLNADTDLDAPEVIFTALQTAGLHRTEAEIADEKAVREQLTAVSVARRSAGGHVALNGVHVLYNKPWQPDFSAARRFAFSGQQLTGLSGDYTWRTRTGLLFGEAARSANGGIAVVNGFQFGAARRVTAALLHRYLGRDYQFVYAAPFAEVNGAANEHGLYAGIQVRPSKPWRIDAYADLWRHPWLRFGVSAPSTGSEYLMRLTWTPLKTFSAYLLGQSERKQQDSDLTRGTLSDNYRERFRIHANYKVGQGLELRSRLEWTRFRSDRPTTGGFMAFQEAVWKPLSGALSGSARYALFDTGSFDARIFAFENDLFAAVSIPAFAGRGVRYFVNLRWRINDRLRLEGRFEQTTVQKAVTTTGITGTETVWKLQARWHFKQRVD